ncbi:hypothetical protein NFI96_026092, partial [Prochilodus magdalenae]
MMRVLHKRSDMYSGLLPKGLSEADLSGSEEDEDHGLKAHSRGDEPDQRSPSPPASTLACQTKQESGSVSCQSECSLQNEPSSDDCLPGVPVNLWQKFKDLQKEREVQTVDQPHRKRRRKRRQRKGIQMNLENRLVILKRKAHVPQLQDKCRLYIQSRIALVSLAVNLSQPEEERAKRWEELTQYFGANDRFQPPACSRPLLKSGLEKSMESAIAEGDYAKAEELSDKLATREMAVKIAQAADCRDFARAKQEEEASRDARKRRKQVAWGPTADIQRAVVSSMSHPVSAGTIARQLHNPGLHAYRTLRRLSLTPRHRHQRLQWCRTRLSWSDSEWQRVIFSDESRFSLGGDAQRIRVWRHRGQHPDERTKNHSVENCRRSGRPRKVSAADEKHINLRYQMSSSAISSEPPGTRGSQ